MTERIQRTQEFVLGNKLLTLNVLDMTKEQHQQYRLVRRMANMAYRYQYGDRDMRAAVEVESMGGIPGYGLVGLLDDIYQRMRKADIVGADSRMDIIRETVGTGWRVGLKPGEEERLYKMFRGQPRRLVMEAIAASRETPVDLDLIRRITGSSDAERIEKTYLVAREKLGVKLGIGGEEEETTAFEID